MRIVAVADTHLFHADLGAMPPGDVFIHAGDLLRRGTMPELFSTLDWLHSLPHRHKIVVAGNHDWCFARFREEAQQALGSEIIYLQDSGVVLDGVRFWGSPWQPQYHSWAFNLQRGEPLAEKWRQIPADTDILITHGPPKGIGDRSDSGDCAGCEDLLRAVQRIEPVLHLFGHIHQDGGFWQGDTTSFANVTTWECLRKPTVLDLDLPNRQVTPRAIPLAMTVT